MDKGVEVKWTVEKSLWNIPERFWGEDLSKLDKHYEGTVIDIDTNWLGETFLTVACKDNKIRKIEYDKVIITTNFK